MNSTLRGMALLVGALLLPDFAQAHPGPHAQGFVAGMAHPLTGADHLLAMVAVGVWAASFGGLGRWIVPASFLAAMAAGAFAGFLGLTLPAHEYAVAASVVMLGALVALRVRIQTVAAATLVALLAIAHGYAHAIEAPARVGLVAFGTGFGISTVFLHAVGLAIGAFVLRESASRFAGAATAVAGAYFVLAV